MRENQILPACESPAARLQFQTNPPHCILVVDDDVSICHRNTRALIDAGYEVDAATDGAAAWDALGAGSYDLMITDNSMPKVTGVELLGKLYAARMSLPVIMATGTLPKAEFARSPWLRPDAMLLKPYTMAEMLRMVKKVLREAVTTTDGSLLCMDRDMKNNRFSQTGEPTGAARQCPTDDPRRILVVDEDRDLRVRYAEALADPGYHVNGAGDGAAG